MDGCIFCKIVRKQIHSELIAESNNFIAIKDIKPVAPGHTLIIPKKHCETLLDFSESYGAELFRFTKQVARNLVDTNYGTGFNILMNNFPVAGQVVMHAHIHIIPRSEGDGLTIIS